MEEDCNAENLQSSIGSFPQIQDISQKTCNAMQRQTADR
jgi:hypothetical protein